MSLQLLFVVALSWDIRLHGVAAGDDLAIGGAQRVQVRLIGLRADVEIGERLSVDFDGNLFVSLRGDLHLPIQGQEEGES